MTPPSGLRGSLLRAAALVTGARTEPGATYPGTVIEGTLGLPGVVQEVVTVQLQQDPPHPRSEVSWAVGQPMPWNKNRLEVTQDEETKTGVGGRGALNAERLHLAPSCSGHCARLSLGIGLRALALWGLACVPPAPNARLSPLAEALRHLAQVRLLPGTGRTHGTVSDRTGPAGARSSFSTGDRAPASTHAPRERRSPAKVAAPVSPSRIPDW